MLSQNVCFKKSTCSTLNMSSACIESKITKSVHWQWPAPPGERVERERVSNDRGADTRTRGKSSRPRQMGRRRRTAPSQRTSPPRPYSRSCRAWNRSEDRRTITRRRKRWRCWSKKRRSKTTSRWWPFREPPKVTRVAPTDATFELRMSMRTSLSHSSRAKLANACLPVSRVLLCDPRTSSGANFLFDVHPLPRGQRRARPCKLKPFLHNFWSCLTLYTQQCGMHFKSDF